MKATAVATSASQRSEAVGLDRKHRSSATAIRAIFRQAFEGAGLVYFNPNSLRKTLARLGEQTCKTPEEFRAWSQNLGHQQVLTTFTSYGAVRADRQGDIIRKLGEEAHGPEPLDTVKLLQQIVRMLERNGMDAGLVRRNLGIRRAVVYIYFVVGFPARPLAGDGDDGWEL